MNTAAFLWNLIEQSGCDAVNIRLAKGQTEAEISIFEGNDVHVVSVSDEEWDNMDGLLASALVCLGEMRLFWKRAVL